jgi:hypothetical protein
VTCHARSACSATPSVSTERLIGDGSMSMSSPPRMLRSSGSVAWYVVMRESKSAPTSSTSRLLSGPLARMRWLNV